MLIKPYPFQERGIDFHLKHHYSLNLCEMGLGKTVMSLGAAEKVGGVFLVLCPAFLVANWQSEIRKYLGDTPKFQILPYSSLSRGYVGSLKNVRMVIADEVHYLKNPGAKRTQYANNLMEKYKPEYFIGLTGTPIKNKAIEFYNLLRLVSSNPKSTSGVDIRKYFPTEDKFGARYCLPKTTYFARGSKTDWQGFQPRRYREFMELLKGKVFKVDGKKVLDLPPIVHKEVQVACKVPAALLEEFEEGGRGSSAKRISAVAKVKHTQEYISNLLENGCAPVVVFSDHVEPAKTIANTFGTQAITGDMSISKRQEIYEKFTKGRQSRVLVATIGSFSVGVNLVNTCNLVFNDISWIPGDNYQALKRIHRIGQTRTCTIHYMLGGLLDGDILRKVQEKMKVINVTNTMAIGIS